MSYQTMMIGQQTTLSTGAVVAAYRAVRRLARDMAERGIIDMVTVNNWIQQ